MADDDSGTVATKRGSAAQTSPSKPVFFKIVATHPALNGRVMFRSVSESRARQWLINHCPRGSEMHLVHTDGSTHSYEAERVGENGADVDRWDPNFDPDEWTPVDQNEPPGDSPWADKEG
jgi:hypothetical protein